MASYKSDGFETRLCISLVLDSDPSPQTTIARNTIDVPKQHVNHSLLASEGKVKREVIFALRNANLVKKKGFRKVKNHSSEIHV